MTENLLKLQNEFVEALYNKKSVAVLKSIKADDQIPKEELIDIYRDGIYANLINALRLTYPRVYDFLKEKKFNEISRSFMKKYRSKSGNLDDYGGEFSEFLAKKEEFFLSKVAGLEWLSHQSYMANDAKLFDLPALQKLSAEELSDVKFDLHPAVFLTISKYNLTSDRRQNKPNKKDLYFVIYRNNLEVDGLKIPESEFNFLTGVKNGLTFYEIYEKYEIDIQFCLQKYIANQVICRFYY